MRTGASESLNEALSRAQPELMACTTDRIKLHWEIWTEESRKFWHRVTWCSISFLVITFYLRKIVSFSVPWINVAPPETLSWVAHLFLLLLCAYLLWLMIFSFVDLMRHRVPDKVEPYVHNNFLPADSLKDKRMRAVSVEQRDVLVEALTGQRIEEKLERAANSAERAKILKEAGLGRDLRTLGRQLYNLVFYGYFGMLGIWLVYVASMQFWGLAFGVTVLTFVVFTMFGAVIWRRRATQE